MLDVCFGDSECGMLRLFLKKDDVFCGFSMLDLGRLAAPDFLSARKQWARQFLSGCPLWDWIHFFREEKKRARQILRRVRAGETPRIWVASCPRSRCGLFRIVHALQGVAEKILVVELPDDDGYRPGGTDRCWGAEDSGFMQACLSLQRELTAQEREDLASCWERLVAENAELRINEDGVIKSVPVDYLDGEIYARSPDGEFALIQAVGAMLGASRHMITDSFVYDRIEAMIAQGRYTVIRAGKDGRTTVLKKTVQKDA